jgi:glycosyltransferase involved in cell wall biosynthesis
VKDLLVTPHTPVLRSGHVMRTYGIARALAAAQGGLTLLYVNFDAPEPDAAFQQIPGIELRGVTPTRGLRRLHAYARARLSGVPKALARGVSSELADAALRLADSPDRGRVIADGPIAAATLERLARKHPMVYNAHNLESGFRHQIDESRFSQTRTLREFERRLLARAVESWMVSEADIAGARELCPEARLRYVPNVIDLARISPVSLPQQERRVIFVASFFYAPNRNGLDFLLDEVFPRVWAELPDTKLTLIGAGLPELPDKDPRVEPVGFVDDLAAAYASASCAVVPLLQGGGTPLKFIEALAYGLPVVATPRAAAGLEVSDGRDCLIAEHPEEFAAALVRVLRNGGEDLARHGRELVAERYSIEALSRLLAEDA